MLGAVATGFSAQAPLLADMSLQADSKG